MAQDEKTIIRSLLDPKIKIDRLEVEDLFTGTSDKLPPSKKNVATGHQEQESLGVQYPFVQINSYVFDPAEIRYFNIDATNFLPSITFTFELTKSDAFRTQSYPKDGDIVSVFLRAKNNAFKPIRNDYVIINVSSSPGGVENMGGTTTITGELFIPHIKDQLIKSYTGNSFDVLQNIAKDLQLGFATNETSTDDSQVWINPGDTWEQHIKQIVDSCWKDEDSFYTCFIDVYYHLNFINVNNQLGDGGQMAAGIFDDISRVGYYPNDVATVEESQVPTVKFLGNLDNLNKTNMFIRNYETINMSSQLHEKEGYKQYLQFFDRKSLKCWSIFVDPKTTDGAENKKIILKGRTFPKKEDQKDAQGKSPSELDYWKHQNQYRWMGIQTKNVHDKYLYATVNNKRNLKELQKLFLKVNVNRWNPNIYNGERIPLLLITQVDKSKASLDAQGTDAEAVQKSPGEPAVLDQFYSGWYMVHGMSITWDSDNSQYSTDKKANMSATPAPAFFQTFTMTRREWPTPLG
jgi:hypothetical protein